MALFDFLKKRKNPPKKENLTLSEAKTQIEQESKKFEKQSAEINAEINEKTNNFVTNLRNQITIIDKIDLKDKREDEKLKLINLQNIKEYIKLTTNLTYYIEKTEKNKEPHDHLNNLESQINTFIKSSRRIFHRATILIGDEIAKSEIIIKSFYKEINEIAEQNKTQISKMIFIKNFQEKQNSLDESKKIQDEINQTITTLSKTKDKKFKQRDETKTDIEKFKQSDSFKTWTKNKEALDKKLRELNQQTILLKEKIDFKSMLKNFHTIDTTRELIKDYQNNFIKTLEGDKKLEIITLLGKDEKESVEPKIKELLEKN